VATSQSSLAVALHPRVATAYPESEAIVYDQRRFTLPCGQRIHAFEHDLLLSAAQQSPVNGKVLEVGCGTGRLMVELLRRGYDVSGIDPSESMLAQLRMKLKREEVSPKLMVGEAAQTNLPSDEYDLVYSIRVLNQTSSPEYALRAVGEMLRVAKPNGLALIEFVNAYRPRWGAARQGMPTRLTPRQVIAAGIETGAHVVNVRGGFFLGMQSYHAAPQMLLPVVSMCDRALSQLLPRLCARTYVLFRKQS